MYGRKRPARATAYRAGYLRSVEWFRRRDRWFETEQAKHGPVRCAVCGKASTPRKFELHHLDYTRVTHEHGTWAAGETHEDLVACHRRCHEWIHKLLDRDKALSNTKDRRTANLQVIARLRTKIATQLDNEKDA